MLLLQFLVNLHDDAVFIRDTESSIAMRRFSIYYHTGIRYARAYWTPADDRQMRVSHIWHYPAMLDAGWKMMC